MGRFWPFRSVLCTDAEGLPLVLPGRPLSTPRSVWSQWRDGATRLSLRSRLQRRLRRWQAWPRADTGAGAGAGAGDTASWCWCWCCFLDVTRKGAASALPLARRLRLCPTSVLRLVHGAGGLGVNGGIDGIPVVQQALPLLQANLRLDRIVVRHVRSLVELLVRQHVDARRIRCNFRCSPPPVSAAPTSPTYVSLSPHTPLSSQKPSSHIEI